MPIFKFVLIATAKLRIVVEHSKFLGHFAWFCDEQWETWGRVQRFTPKKRTVPVICFESEIDRLVYQLYGLTEEEIEIALVTNIFHKCSLPHTPL